MFEGDVTELDTTGLLASVAAHRAEVNRLEARLLEHAQHFADLHNPDTLRGFTACDNGSVDDTGSQVPRGRRPGRERAIVLGGAGCPAIAEFAVAEFGVMLGVSAGTAADYIGQALALRHRLPRVWAAVLSGGATPWKARLLAKACLHLSQAAAAIVDHRVAGLVDTISAIRLNKVITAAIYLADEQAARAAAEEKTRERGVYVNPAEAHGTRSVYIRAGSGDVLRFDATLNEIAHALAELGDTDPLRLRRAKAIGILADPDHAQALLTTATPTTAIATDGEARRHTNDVAAGPPERAEPWDEPSDDAPLMNSAAERALNANLSALPGIHRSRSGRTVVYVHLTDHTLATGSGVLRAEGIGPLLASQLTELIGHRSYVVKPVIDLNHHISVDAYEIPRRLREQVKLIHPVEQFPYGTAETTLATDLDHIEPFDPHGPPGQTATTKLIPLRRFSHRVKTHGRWKVRRLPGGALEWTSPHRFKFRVDHTGTHPTDP